MTIDDLLRAAGRGESEEVLRWIDQGIPIDAQNEYGGNALMAAAASYRVAVVRLLISKDANPNAQADEGHRVLHRAVSSTPSQPDQQAECVRLLLEAGADPNVENESGTTPLMNAAWFGCPLAAKTLLDGGADPDHADRQGRTAISMAESRGHTSLVNLLSDGLHSREDGNVT